MNLTLKYIFNIWGRCRMSLIDHSAVAGRKTITSAWQFPFCRSLGRSVERPGSGETGEGRTQTHTGGGPTEIQGPCGRQAGPACRPQEPSKQNKNTSHFSEACSPTEFIHNMFCSVVCDENKIIVFCLTSDFFIPKPPLCFLNLDLLFGPASVALWC